MGGLLYQELSYVRFLTDVWGYRVKNINLNDEQSIGKQY